MGRYRVEGGGEIRERYGVNWSRYIGYRVLNIGRSEISRVW